MSWFTCREVFSMTSPLCPLQTHQSAMPASHPPGSAKVFNSQIHLYPLDRQVSVVCTTLHLLLKRTVTWEFLDFHPCCVTLLLQKKKKKREKKAWLVSQSHRLNCIKHYHLISNCWSWTPLSNSDIGSAVCFGGNFSVIWWSRLVVGFKPCTWKETLSTAPIFLDGYWYFWQSLR